jgi:hypothetical protein
VTLTFEESYRKKQPGEEGQLSHEYLMLSLTHPNIDRQIIQYLVIPTSPPLHQSYAFVQRRLATRAAVN